MIRIPKCRRCDAALALFPVREKGEITHVKLACPDTNCRLNGKPVKDVVWAKVKEDGL